ncbi:hypothetical protein QQY24_01300 [Streptomyces sp. TG1A-8]|uniref:hypothetical protein n=1 Tax=Streptomyces sp. TG1A-8 TaxID=3051385 RepID=UPI00265C6C0B|nr:hypothetical protein [Streptomyces sp. TG1A-8]MDO0924123.1 hypothetical protein [Streptomyces sp. TG1A-8]
MIIDEQDPLSQQTLAKPGALADSEALDQARREGPFASVHEAFWSAAKQGLGEIEGTEVLVHILLLHRHLQHRDVVAGIRAAPVIHVRTADMVALEARKAAESEGCSPTITAPLPEPVALPDLQLSSLTERRATRLPRPAPLRGGDRPRHGRTLLRRTRPTPRSGSRQSRSPRTPRPR